MYPFSQRIVAHRVILPFVQTDIGLQVYGLLMKHVLYSFTRFRMARLTQTKNGDMIKHGSQ